MPGLAPPHPSPNPPKYGINVENFGPHAPHNSALSKSKAIFIDWTKKSLTKYWLNDKELPNCSMKGVSYHSEKEIIKNVAKTVKNVPIQSTAPPIYSKTFLRFLCQFQYLYDPKVEKNHFSKSPHQNISKLGLNNAHMISL